MSQLWARSLWPAESFFRLCWSRFKRLPILSDPCPSAWGHLAFYFSTLMATTCLFYPNAIPFNPIHSCRLGKIEAACTAWFPRSPCQEGKKRTYTFSRIILWNLVGCEDSSLQPPQEITLHPADSHERFCRDFEQFVQQFKQSYCLLHEKQAARSSAVV